MSKVMLRNHFLRKVLYQIQICLRGSLFRFQVGRHDCYIGAARDGKVGPCRFNVEHDNLLDTIRFRYREGEETQGATSAEQIKTLARFPPPYGDGWWVRQ